jgi:RNA polymerase sigma-70 factor (ECF subfamily)
VTSATSFEALVAEVWEPLQRYLRRRTDPSTAEDVLGDVLLVMWRRCADVPADAALPWCYGVARGCLANALRSSDRRLRLVRRLAAERPASETSTEDPVLDQALHALSPAEQELLRLWAWEQLSASEIALVLGITPNAASLRLQRATTKLKKELLRRQDAAVPGHLVERRGEETR